jgi:hypothetical protein
VLASGVVAATWVSIVRGDPAAPLVPVVVKAEPVASWNAKFAGTKGWIGGDGAYSTTLSPERVLWLFGDTILGAVKDGRRAGAVMVNNTIGVQAGIRRDAAIRFLAGKTRDDKPAAFFIPADNKGWFWPQAAIRVGDRLFIFLAQVERTKGRGVFAFKHIGQWLATVANPDDEPEKWRVKQRKLPHASFRPDRERSWGAAILADGKYLYVYGYDATKGQWIGKRRLTVARVPAGKYADFSAWQFRTSNGWSESPGDAVGLADGLATEFSITRAPVGKGFVAVYTENGLSDRIVGRFANAPEGPWSTPRLLYTCPEMAKDKGVFCYAAKAHRWAVTENALVISYCVNTWEFARLFRDEKVYRPKVVRVELGAVR